MMIIDQQAAHERILFERFAGAGKAQSRPIVSRACFRRPLHLLPRILLLVLEMQKEIEALGFRFAVFGKNQWL